MKPMRQHQPTTSVSKDIFESFAFLFREQPMLVGTLWLVMFVALFGFSWALGIVPKIDASSDEPEVVVDAETPSDVEVDGTPVRIVIDEIDLDQTVVVPESASIEDLDRALLSGVVHYPGSADLDEDGNVFLFGHSTGFRVVNNPAFKAFNDIKNLERGDLIRVRSATREYVYRVTSVDEVKATDASVDLRRAGRKLTLVTCNAFGAKEDRYFVEAEFVGDYPLEE